MSLISSNFTTIFSKLSCVLLKCQAYFPFLMLLFLYCYTFNNLILMQLHFTCQQHNFHYKQKIIKSRYQHIVKMFLDIQTLILNRCSFPQFSPWCKDQSVKQLNHIEYFEGKILPQVNENLIVSLSSGNRSISIVQKEGFHLYIIVSHCSYHSNSEST